MTAQATSPPEMTVVICTRNRAESLRRTLASLVAADPPGTSWDVVVVDNGSQDRTVEVVAAFKDRLDIRCVTEPTPGLSVARNRGVAEARGRYLVWTDDDVVVDPGWLRAYAAAFAAHPEAALFAGQVQPLLEPPSPDWFREGADHLQELMAVRRFDAVLPLSPDLLPYGASFAVRADVQGRHLYDPNLGVAPGRRTGGEETAVAVAILAEGGLGLTVPAATLRHMIPPARQTRAYVRDFYEAHGEAYPMRWTAGRPRPLVGRVPPRLLFELARTQLDYLVRRLMRLDWLPAFVMNARYRGVLTHIRRQP